MFSVLHQKVFGSALDQACSAKQLGSKMSKARFVIGCILAATAVLSAVPAGAVESSPDANLHQWQLRRLNDPTEHERAQEREGKVYIYDGLTAREVDQALDAHFDRIESMMFMGTRRTEPTGQVSTDANGAAETESPGCL